MMKIQSGAFEMLRRIGLLVLQDSFVVQELYLISLSDLIYMLGSNKYHQQYLRWLYIISLNPSDIESRELKLNPLK